MIAALLPALVPILGDALKRLFPDAEARQRAEAELNAALLARAGELEKAAADIIKAEAQSEHWLAACWRPILMLTFGILIVLRWLGWSAPGISEAEALKLWNIVEIGLGGYPNAIAIGAGDMIGLAGRLYIATEAITASGTGTATIPIAPPLREALLVNQPLVLTKPTVPMRLVSDDEAANPTRPGRFTAITIRLEEAL